MKFADLELGLVDRVVAAAAERLRVHRILTVDREDFEPLRAGEGYNQSFEMVP